MTRNSISATAACVCFAVAGLSSPLRAELKPEQLYAAVAPSIVALDVENFAGKHFVANAFLAWGQHFAVTAWHVVHDARRVEARFSDKSVLNDRGEAIGVVSWRKADAE